MVKLISLNTASGLGVTTLVICASIPKGSDGVGDVVGVSVTKGVLVSVGGSVIVGVSVMVGVSVIVGVRVGVGDGGKY